MTHDAYLQYKALSSQYTNLVFLEVKIKEAVPEQLGEAAYDYNRALTQQIRKDLFQVLDKHKINIQHLMDDL